MTTLAPQRADRSATRVLYLLTSEMSTVFVRGQLAALERAGFDVHLATSWQGTARSIDEGVTTWEIPFERDPHPRADLRAFRASLALMRRIRPQIVHAGTPKAALIGMLAAFVARVPARIYALHGLRYETAQGVARAVYKAAERLASACSTVVICDSPSMRDRAVGDRLVPQRKIRVLGRGSANGVDTHRFSPGAGHPNARERLGVARFELVIGFVGRLTHDKGIDDLVAVFRERFADRSGVGLLLVGPFEEGDAISSSTRAEIGGSAQIVHVPWLDDTTDAYGAMDVLAFPSYREGLPNVPLEAQASGVPVVGYAATGTVDAVAPDTLAAIGDQQHLGELLERMISDDDHRRTVGDAGRALVIERFGQDEVWGRRIELFRSL